MAEIDFGGTKENVVTRKEFSVAKAKKIDQLEDGLDTTFRRIPRPICKRWLYLRLRNSHQTIKKIISHGCKTE